jgi:hypothetical protein
MVKKWLHIAYLGGDPWVLPIYSAKNNALKKNTIKEFGKDIYELGMHISTRLNMLPRIIKRLDRGCAALYADKKIKALDLSNLSYKDKLGRAVKIEDDLVYQLLIDIDSLLFELNACCEFMQDFVSKIYNHTEKNIEKKNAGKIIKKIIVDSGGSADWFNKLDKHRNFFMHVGTPYFAIDFSNMPKKYDLLIMKENLKRFDDKDKYIPLSELGHIVKGFIHARRVLQQHLIEHINNL